MMAQQNTPMPQTPPPKPQKSETPPPPEAYAAFVRIYVEWMEKSEDEQVDMAKDSVRNARSAVNHCSNGVVSGYSGKANPELLGLQFEEYVNTVWLEFAEMCDNADEFAAYLQNHFDAVMRKYQLMVNKFLDDVFTEWDNATVNLYGAALDRYFKLEIPKREAQFRQMKADFEKRNPAFPSLDTLLRRPAQNMIVRRLGEVKRDSKGVSLDADINEAGPLEIADVSSSGSSYESGLALWDVIFNVVRTLDKRDQKIFQMRMEGYKQKDMAKELGISDAAVSIRFKKILAKLRLAYENSNKP